MSVVLVYGSISAEAGSYYLQTAQDSAEHGRAQKMLETKVIK
jgi:hypothetical protein